MKQLFGLMAFVSLLALPLACTPSDKPAETETSAVPGSQPMTQSTARNEPLGMAPDFTLPTLEGDSLRLSDYRGRVVLLNFWATWCTPCIAEMPDLLALQNELGPHGLSIIGVSLDDEGPDIVGPFARRLNITYPLVLDDGTVANALGGVWALPTTYVVDPEGRILQRIIGLFPVEDMRPQFRQMLDLPPVTTTAY